MIFPSFSGPFSVSPRAPSFSAPSQLCLCVGSLPCIPAWITSWGSWGQTQYIYFIILTLIFLYTALGNNVTVQMRRCLPLCTSCVLRTGGGGVVCLIKHSLLLSNTITYVYIWSLSQRYRFITIIVGRSGNHTCTPISGFCCGCICWRHVGSWWFPPSFPPCISPCSFCSGSLGPMFSLPDSSWDLNLRWKIHIPDHWFE